MQGACFTLSNLGTFGVEAFTPVINPPESAILGIGAIVREAVPLDDGTFAARERMTLSLTFDHRVIDGAPAARFLQTLRQLIEQPFLGLV
jgi:pyruvate dehydrogenase E2 component (dihydrolipoamide acetyltransferase)